MKKIENANFISFIAMLIILGFNNLNATDDQNAFWLNNLEEAQQQAKEQNKKILMYFSGSDWCLPCMQLKIEVFEQETFKSFTHKNFIPVAFDFPARETNKLPEERQKYNDGMAEKYNAEGAFPLLLILDSSGLELGEINGYSREKAEKYIKKLSLILEKNK